MKTYQKAELIAKNLPTGSYAAGCPVGRHEMGGGVRDERGYWHGDCYICEVAQ